MAATVSWDALRELAGFRAGKGVAVSFYLDLDLSHTPTAGDLATRTNSLLGEAGRHGDRSQLNHDQRKSLTADLERIRNYVENDLVRDGARGLAVFTDDLDNLWRPLALTDSVPDAVKVDAELYLTPLVPLVGRGEGALVAVVGRERGELYRLRGGRLEQLANLSEEQPEASRPGRLVAGELPAPRRPSRPGAPPGRGVRARPARAQGNRADRRRQHGGDPRGLRRPAAEERPERDRRLDGSRGARRAARAARLRPRRSSKPGGPARRK